MTDNQSNDNLEQFFRKNLEHYSPEPPAGFWDRMEPSIPAKPPVWGSWAAAAGKWLGAGLLIGAIVLAGVLWRDDRQQLQELSLLVKAQQLEMEQIRKSQDSPVQAEAETHKAGQEKDEQLHSNNRKNEAVEAFFGKNGAEMAGRDEGPFFTKNKNTTKRTGRSDENIAPGSFWENPMEAIVLKGETGTEAANFVRDSLEVPPTIEYALTKGLSIQPPAPVVKLSEPVEVSRHSGFSFEAGTSAFFMPGSRLFENDSVMFVTGAVRPSTQAGLLVNFEMNSSWALQTGFHFKNIRSQHLSLRYNSFPMTVRRRWALSHRTRLEAKTGLALNSLINAKTSPEKTTLHGLRTTYFSWLGGTGLAWPLGESLTFVTEANLGYPLSPVANGRRPIEAGVYMGLRFSIR